jgi:O-succinylbenzoic acid--CoA ligase
MTRLTLDPLLERVANDPAAPALSARSASWSRAELLDAADGLATALLSEGLRAGDRVACLLEDDAPMVALVHAVRRMGAVLVPLNRRAARVELQAQLRAVGAAALVYDRSNAESALASLPGGLPGHRVEVLLAGAPCAVPPALRGRIDLDSPATIVFTSGTTGRPRGAVLTHDNQRASAHAWAGILRPVPGHQWLGCLPLFHVGGLAIITRVTRWGAPLRLLDRFEPQAVRAALDEGVTHLSLVPAQLRALLDVRAGAKAPYTLEAVLLGGGPIPTELVTEARALGYRVLTTYGMTETGSGVACGGADAATLADPSAGRALPGVRLRVEPDGSADGSGEILVRGEMVFEGYLDDPQATAVKLRDGWLHTGDVGTLDGQGLLRVADRRDDLVVSGGENVYPAEVEAVLTAHAAVAEAAVVGQPDPRWGSVPVAFVVPAAGAQPDREQLRRHCRERLAGYKVPVRVEIVEELPRNAFGKVQRHVLRQQLGTPAP